MRHTTLALLLIGCGLLPSPAAGRQQPSTGDEPLTLEHYVPVRSTVPAIEGETVQLYVRERVRADVLEAGAPSAGVVLFVHGAGTPGEVAFDARHEDYSWMAYLAAAGFDVFSVEMTGYGRSTRPAPMNDPCNLPAARQALLAPIPLPSPCTPSYPHRLTTAGSDWNDIGAAVDYVRALRGVERVSLVGWSQGGPRAGGYAALHPEEVDRLVLLAPAYRRDSAKDPPEGLTGNAPMGTQTLDEFQANLERQARCEGQLDPAAVPALWSQMLGTDPVAATWGPGMRRAPQTVSWGWNAEVVATVRAPALLVAGVHDAQVSPARVRELHEDLGSGEKVLLDLGCASHAAMWETNRLLLFGASLEWLTRGSVQGMRTGVVRLGY